MIIDFHTHVVPPRVKERRREYLGRDPTFDLFYSDPKSRLATAEDVIASMDADGVDISVLLSLGWASHELCVEANDYMMESVARYPGRLVGFCTLQPRAGREALRELERCLGAGLRGVGELRPDIQGFDLQDRATMEPLVDMGRDHGAIFLLHASEPVGHEYPGKGTVTPEIIYPFICRYPGLDLVLAHWGGGLPFYALMPEVARALQNVYFDTSASSFLYRPQVFGQVTDIIGTRKVLFGSDFPLVPQARPIGEIEALDLSPEAKRLVLGENARSLLAL